MEWLLQNIPTAIICIIIAFLVFFAIRYMVRQKKRGGSIGCTSCNGDCAKCAYKCKSNSKKEKITKDFKNKN